MEKACRNSGVDCVKQCGKGIKHWKECVKGDIRKLNLQKAYALHRQACPICNSAKLLLSNYIYLILLRSNKEQNDIIYTMN